MNKKVVVLLLVLFNLVLKAQVFKVVTRDNDTVTCRVFENENIYKVYIKTSKILYNQKPYLAYLYQIDSNGIIVCNVNPQKIDTSKLNQVKFRKFYFSNITSLKINKDKNGLKAAISIGISGLISGIITHQTGDGFYLTRSDKVALAISTVMGLGFYALYLPMAIPKKIKLNKKLARNIYIVNQLVKKTKYKVY